MEPEGMRPEGMRPEGMRPEGMEQEGMEQERMKKERKLEYFGGLPGAVLPFAILLFMIISFAITGKASLQNYWIAAFAAFCTGFLLAKDKGYFQTEALKGLQDPVLASLILIYLLAGILSITLQQSGLMDGLLWLCVSLKLNAAFLPAVYFIVCALISVSCGTTIGTVSAVMPVLFPLAMQLGCNPALIMGAVLSGSFAGNDIAPIADTVIASSAGMGVNPTQSVRHRIRYSAVAAVTAIIAYLVAGMLLSGSGAITVSAEASKAIYLVVLIVPALMIFMMFKGLGLTSVLIICDIVSIVLNMLLGKLSLSTLLTTDGPVVKGISGMISVIVFSMFLFILIRQLRTSGVLDDFVELIAGKCHSARQAELVIGGMSALMTVTTAMNTVAVMITGTVAKKLCERFGIDPYRGCNILNGFAVGISVLGPFGIAMMVILGFYQSSEYVTANLNSFNISGFSFYGIAQLIIYTIMICIGDASSHQRTKA